MPNAPKISIKNVVATFKLDKRLNLKEVHQAFLRESIWKDTVFKRKVVVFRLKNPKMSFLIYETGSVVCAGAESIKDAKQSGNYLIEQFRSAGINVKLSKPAEIQNIVASANLNTKLDLRKISIENSEIEHEPEQFPAAIWRAPTGVTLLLFPRGGVVCVGAKKYENITKTIDKLKRNLRI
jgi:transcription initiation factor TFIID TATA-box-binding protein